MVTQLQRFNLYHRLYQAPSACYRKRPFQKARGNPVSANLIVDLGNTAYMYPGHPTVTVFPASGAEIGNVLDMIEADTFTNLLLVGKPAINSGQLRVAVQTSDDGRDISLSSGSFTDPTSGMDLTNRPFPTAFESGGILRLNSGGLGTGLFGAGTSGQYIRSGFIVAGAFQRPHRYVRANLISGDFYFGTFFSAFVGQKHITGSGGGYWTTSGITPVNV